MLGPLPEKHRSSGFASVPARVLTEGPSTLPPPRETGRLALEPEAWRGLSLWGSGHLFWAIPNFFPTCLPTRLVPGTQVGTGQKAPALAPRSLVNCETLGHTPLSWPPTASK